MNFSSLTHKAFLLGSVSTLAFVAGCGQPFSAKVKSAFDTPSGTASIEAEISTDEKEKPLSSEKALPLPYDDEITARQSAK